MATSSDSAGSPRGDADLSSSERVGRVACALALCMITIAFYLNPVADMALEAVFVTFVGIATIYCMRASDLRYRMSLVILFILPFVALMLASVLVNSASYGSEAMTAFVEILNTGLILWVGLAFCSLSTSKLESLLTTVAVMICAFLTIALVVHWSERYGGRFIGNGLHPNWWGAIAYGAGCCAIFIKARWLRWACYIAVVAMMLSTSSRGSLLGFATMLAALYVQNFRLRHIAYVSLGLGLSGLVALLTPVGAAIYSYVASDILLLDNVYRGAATGFTGRYAGWLGALDLIADHPLFGVGHGMLPTLHNGYLVALGEYGVVASLFFFSALVTSIFWGRDYRITAVVLSYAAFMVFAPRTINMVLGSLIPSILMMAGLARLTWPATSAPRGGADLAASDHRVSIPT